MDDQQINELVTRLSRPHPSGGVVIERAAILAAGADSPAVIDWIIAHSGTPDTAVRTVQGRGLHGSRMNDDSHSTPQVPLRFVLPAGSLS
jgi:enterochelin esterase-like enzyme